jgi:hypothetical protein
MSALIALSFAGPASGGCVNRFFSRTEQARQSVTLLTGKLTYQEAQTLAAAIQAKQSPVLEWVDDGGKTIARQFGDIKVVRPMPVGCDGKTSGVLLMVYFSTTKQAIKTMNVKMNPDMTVTFEQQAE